MGLFGRKANYTAQTIGTIVGVSAVKVNNMNLPLAEYVVDGQKYKVRVPHEIAKNLEKQSTQQPEFVRANLNYGNSNIQMQKTKIQGFQVTVMYDPKNPKKAKVVV